jgi:serpin B
MIVINPTSQPEMTVVQSLRTTSEVILDDLSRMATVKLVNDWAFNQTHGSVSKIFEGPQRQADLVGINVVYFKGKWQEQFHPQRTMARLFRVFDGGTIEVPMMRRVGFLPYRNAGRFIAVDLPYQDDRFSLVVATTIDRPASLIEFTGVHHWLAGEGFGAGPVDLALPRFTLTDGTDLLEAIDRMGLVDARKSPRPFSRLSPMLGPISRVAQQTYLRVDEEGTEGTATTTVTTSRHAAPDSPVLMIVDRPFIFALRDGLSGLIVLSGYVGRI